jgi:hypothetical protein
MFPFNMFTLQPVSSDFFLGGGGGWWSNPSVEVTVNGKEENSEDFCPNYVQEFGLKPKNSDRPSIRGRGVQHCTYCIRRVSAGPGVEGALRVNDTSNLVGGGGGGGEPSRPGAAWLSSLFP